jgi:hypothetical protein
VLGPLSNQAERIFQDDNITPTNQQTKQELDQNKSWIKTRFTYEVTFVALGSLDCDKPVE